MSGPPAPGRDTPAPSPTPDSAPPRPAVAAAAAVVTALALAGGLAVGAGVLGGSAAPPALPPGADDSGARVETVPATSADRVRDLAADDRPSPEEEAAAPSPEWLDSTSAATGVPRRALEAYATAQLLLMVDRPECRVSWPTLAGIGEIESHHGTYTGGELGPDGRTTEDIIGIPLDGTNNTAAIRDTDGGDYDGDTEWDRAVGPMQFIPKTWTKWGADADGDGEADPHDMDDAAYTAARYLCAEGRDLTDDDGWWDAVLTYNESEEYANDVLDVAARLVADAG